MVQAPLLLVEGLKTLPVLRAPYDNFMPADLVIVIGMHGLAVFEHHVICDVHQIVDRADPGGRKAKLHPFRRGRKAQIFHYARGIARAELRILHLDLQKLMHIPASLRSILLRRKKALSEGRRRLPRDAEHTVAVHPVRGDFILVERIV